MKKIIVLIMVLILTLTISGCEKQKKDEFSTGIEGVIEYNCWREGNTSITVAYYCTVQDEFGEQTIRVSSSEYTFLRKVSLGLETLMVDDATYYTQEEVAEMYNIQQGYIDDLELRIEELEERIAELE